MPDAPKRPCRYPSCPKLVDSGYCAAHTAQQPKRQYADTRESACKRGYDRRWRRFRIAYLRQHPLCVDHLAQGLVAAAEEPHHVIKLTLRPDLKYDENNLMALCGDCHKVRTARGE